MPPTKIKKPIPAWTKPRKLSNAKDYDWRRDGTTQSILSAFVQCRRLAGYILGRWEPIKTKDALVFGSLWHTIMEYYGTALMEAQPIPSFAEIVKHARMSGAVPHGDQKAEIMLAMAGALYNGYVKMWAKKDAKVKFVFVEQVCDERLSAPFPDIRFRGKIDAGTRVKSKLWLVERKTRAQLDEGNLTNALAFDFQSQCYTFLAEERFQEDVTGISYDVVSKPQHRFTDKDSIESYSAKIAAAIQAEPAKYFNRYEIVQPARNKEEFLVELRMKLADFISWREGVMPTYANQSACIGRGVCDFLECCGARAMIGCVQTRRLFRELEEGA